MSDKWVIAVKKTSERCGCCRQRFIAYPASNDMLDQIIAICSGDDTEKLIICEEIETRKES